MGEAASGGLQRRYLNQKATELPFTQLYMLVPH